MSYRFKVLTPTEAIQRLADNDQTLTKVDLSKNAVLQMKGGELIPKLAAALAHNRYCQELVLSDCNLGDQMAADLASALKTNNTLVHLDLQENKIKDEGATALANALAQNRTLMQLNLLNQKGSRFGDATLHAFGDMFDTNITLLKIVWRLESRQSFALNKKIVRNNDIDRRIKANRDYADLLPEKAQPISEELVAQRTESAAFVGINTPRASSMENVPNSARVDSARERGDSLPATAPAPPRPMPASYPAAPAPALAPPAAEPEPPPPPPPPPAPAISAPDSDLEAKLVALELELEEKVAALKADYAAKKLALIESHQ